MICRWTPSFLAPALAVVVLSASLASQAQTKPLLVTQKIDNSVLVTLGGNTRPEANAQNDQGPLTENLQFDHMLMVLKRPAATETQLEQFIANLHNPASASYHKWLSAAQFGETYGPAESDVAAVTSWLESEGFTVNVVYANNMVIDFSGTSSQVEAAFHTSIHNYNVSGVGHIANASDPKIPAALGLVVGGVVSLHDFAPRTMHEPIAAAHIDPKSRSLYSSQYTTDLPSLAVAPWDLQKIYNIAPLLTAGISGQGMKVVVVEDTNQFNCNATNAAGNSPGTPCSATSDWSVFRKTFGLIRYPAGNLSQENPAPQTGANNCTTPSTTKGYPTGVNSDDVEASIDVQWASAAAPSASIVNAACASPRGSFGGLIAIQNILSHPNAENVDTISMSYGESEEQTGAALNAAFNTTFQQAVTQGIGIFVSSGDEDAASSSDEGAEAKDGISISGWMSSPYDVSVGGLDFADTYLGENATYWSATNNVFYGSAKSYMPEQPWNDSCAGQLISNILGFPTTYGTGSFCNDQNGAVASADGLLLAVGGSGGPSACATGVDAVAGVAGGTCAGYPKPAWQSGLFGLPNDGVRDTPDVSLMAANGLWGHYYPICYSNTLDTADGGTPCVGQPSNWPGFGGTSISSPIMAAIQALVVQHKGSLQGLPTMRYYALAKTEYGVSGSAACNSSNGNGVASSCIFYDVTLGDNTADCEAHAGATGLVNCYKPSGTFGVLSTSNTAFQPAYAATPGWDFTSGIGSVNAYNLVMAY